ncbi:uncharacterized protein LOC119163784 isoform X1 [Rhipicephalus microplus]|uniref:uncharacterized protein LOC119163784 isoform X1 n=2 Tax=Rhipicephalus microplus TaxID=6941 RepID=UPI003F6D43A4
MARLSTRNVLLRFLFGFVGPTTYLIFAMGYQLCYDFDNVISRKGGATNVFTSISRATATRPWYFGWVIAMITHSVFHCSIKDDFREFWLARQELVPPEERDRYLTLVHHARNDFWMRAFSLLIIAIFPVSLSISFHFVCVGFYFVSDFGYLRAVDFLEAKLARRRDSTAVYLRSHHGPAKRTMHALFFGIALSLALHVFAEVSYAHSAFGFFELLYGGVHGWHELVTCMVIIAGRRDISCVPETPLQEPPLEETPLQEPPLEEPPLQEPPLEETPLQEPPVEEPPVQEPPVHEAEGGAGPIESPQGVLRSRRILGLPPEFAPLK